MNDLFIQQLLNVMLRSVIAYFLLLLVSYLLRRKILSQMNFFDLGISIVLGAVAAAIAIGRSPTILSAIIVFITLCLLGILTDSMQLTSFFINKIIDAEPIILIQNGELVKTEMKKMRLSVTELDAMLRQKGVFNIADVEFAVLEKNGELSVQQKSQKQPLTPSDLNIPTSYKGLTKDLVIEGQILYENLKQANLDELWLMNELNSRGIEDVAEVFLAALDTCGNLYVSKGLAYQTSSEAIPN